MRYLVRRCWRIRLLEALPSAVLDYPFSVSLAMITAVYGPTALVGSPVGAIHALPTWLSVAWGVMVTFGSVAIFAALWRGRVGTWLPTGLWVCGTALLAYVVLVVLALDFHTYQPRVTFSAVMGVVAVVQAFKLQTGHLWAVAALRAAGPGGLRGE